VKGPISALSGSSITVIGKDGSVTCAIPAGMSLSAYAVGNPVDMDCGAVSGTLTLTKIEAELKGSISALSGSSITVRSQTNSLTCGIPTGVALSGYAVGDRVKLECRSVSGRLMLDDIEHEDDD
jgi:hypothetical protein